MTTTPGVIGALTTPDLPEMSDVTKSPREVEQYLARTENPPGPAAPAAPALPAARAEVLRAGPGGPTIAGPPECHPSRAVEGHDAGRRAGNSSVPWPGRPLHPVGVGGFGEAERRKRADGERGQVLIQLRAGDGAG